MVEQCHADPDYAAGLLFEVRRNGDWVELAILLPEMTEAFGKTRGESLPMQNSCYRLLNRLWHISWYWERPVQ